MQKVWILLSWQPLIPWKSMGDYYHNHHAGHPCFRGALCEAPEEKHTVLFPLNTHRFDLLSPRNCCNTNPVLSGRGGGHYGICKKNKKKERMDGDQSFCLSFKEMHRFFSPSLKRRKKEKKRWTINSDEDIKLGHRLKFEFQDITADVKPPNRIQCNRIPLFCALKLPLFPDQPGEGKINSAGIDINVQHYASKWNQSSRDDSRAFINNMCANLITLQFQLSGVILSSKMELLLLHRSALTTRLIGV